MNIPGRTECPKVERSSVHFGGGITGNSSVNNSTLCTPQTHSSEEHQGKCSTLR